MRTTSQLLKRHFNVGNLLSLEIFTQSVNHKRLTDEDGYGFWATNTQYLDHLEDPIMPSTFNTRKAPPWATHIIWFIK